MSRRQCVTLLAAVALGVPTVVVGQSEALASAAPVARGLLLGVQAGTPYTVTIGVEELLPNGDIAVHPLASREVTDQEFVLAGPLRVPARRNPDGSVPLNIQVTGNGVTKIFDVNAFAPDAAHEAWRWTRTPDADLVQGRTASVAATPLTHIVLDMTDAAAAPGISATTELPRSSPSVAGAMRAGTGTQQAEATSGMNCNSPTWAAATEAVYAKRWVPVQRITMHRNATQRYAWSTSKGTQTQIAYAGANRVWAGGFGYSIEHGTETGFDAAITESYWAGFIRTRWRFVRQDQYCSSTSWPYGAVRSGVRRWYPNNWDGSALPLKDIGTWHCKKGTKAVSRYKEWTSKSTTSRMNGQFSLAGVKLDVMQTNSWRARHQFSPRKGRTYAMCGNTADPPYSRLVKEILP